MAEPQLTLFFAQSVSQGLGQRPPSLLELSVLPDAVLAELQGRHPFFSFTGHLWTHSAVADPSVRLPFSPFLFCDARY